MGLPAIGTKYKIRMVGALVRICMRPALLNLAAIGIMLLIPGRFI